MYKALLTEAVACEREAGTGLRGFRRATTCLLGETWQKGKGAGSNVGRAGHCYLPSCQGHHS